MALSGSLPPINLGVQGETQGGLQSGAQQVNPEFRGHLTGRALDWFEVLGYRVVGDKATDLKQDLTEQLVVVRNRLELETRFSTSSQKHNQKSSDFVYDFLKIHKILKLEMTAEKLIDHIISRLEPQILDYVEVRHPQTTSNLLQIIDNYEERFLNRKISGSSWEFRDTNPSENNRFPSRKIGGKRGVTTDTRTMADHGESSIDLRFKVLRITGDSMVDASGGQSDHRFHNPGGRQGGSRNSVSG
ncbi:uncharacterized protein TNCV_4171221 [Trichonephila clavipes]|nr:uncharacterized protein TNCV_4171221 [Trichonephila clavipes]